MRVPVRCQITQPTSRRWAPLSVAATATAAADAVRGGSCDRALPTVEKKRCGSGGIDGGGRRGSSGRALLLNEK